MQGVFEVAQERGGGRAVEDPVIDRQGELDHRPPGQLPITDDRFLGSRPDGEDGRLGRVDDRSEVVDAEHAEVADREGTASEFLRGQLPGAGPLREHACLGGDLAQALAVCVADDRDDEPVAEGDGDAHVDPPVQNDLVAAPRGVHLRVPAQCDRAGPDQQVGDADFRPGSRQPVVGLCTECEQRAGDDIDHLPASVEGGDIHVIGHGTVLIGMGERTTPAAVEIVTQALFAKGQATQVIAIELPRAGLHVGDVGLQQRRDVLRIGRVLAV
ncbi:MAG: hypothetical protein DLM62_08450, partial [Pseudonocardiales bacterium]